MRTNKMQITSKVVKFSKKRKIVEIPKAARDNFVVGEEVLIKKKDHKTEQKGKK